MAIKKEVPKVNLFHMRTVVMMVVLLVSFVGCKSQTNVIRIEKGVPLQEQFNQPNVTYLIEETIDIGGEIIKIPANSALKFEKKGALVNGVIQGDNTNIVGNPEFDGVRLRGTFVNEDYYASWCSSHSISDFVEDVMNVSDNSVLIVDCNITLNDQKKYVNHLTLVGKDKTITNSDRYYITYGGADISNLSFRWDKPPLDEPKDNYDAVIIYFDLLLKDTTVVTRIENVDADGGRYCSYFMRQYKGGIEPKLHAVNAIINCDFRNFTMGAIWTCGGTGKVFSTSFTDIGYEKSSKLRGVTALRLGYNHKSREAKVVGYVVEDCEFENFVAVYNPENDGRGLHGLLAYGDSIVVRNNKFSTLSTSFSKATDPGMDSEMLYIKGSYNLIEGNTFENGAGSSSDGVVTLKVSDTEGNIVRNNQFLITNTPSKFIYLGGHNHIVEGNDFVSTYSVPRENNAYAIYLGHREKNGDCESVIIRNNTFSFTGKANYMAIYANKRGDIILENNTFNNSTVLLKCDKRQGTVIIQGNVVSMDHVQGRPKDNIILVSGDNGRPVIICDNEITISHSVTGNLINGSNYCFNNNRVILHNSSIQALLRGAETRIEAKKNSFSIEEDVRLSKNAVVGERESSMIKIEDNRFEERLCQSFLE